jgi:hypothetical protein
MPVTVVEMSEQRDTHTKEQNKPRRWLTTLRQALWAIGMLVSLMTIVLLVGNLDLAIWEDLSGGQRERIATIIGIVAALTVIVVLLALGGASRGWTGFGDKKLWDWLQLLSALAVPVVLAVAGFCLRRSKIQGSKQLRSSVRRMRRCKRTSIR